MNSRNLFYVRDLQIKFSFKNSKIIKSLFFLEYYLFNLNVKVEETLVFKLKLKWLYDEINKNNFSNEITSNLIPFKDKILKKKVLKIIEVFSDLIYPLKIENVEEIFEKLNKEFNFIIHQEYSNFDSSFKFQMIQYLYNNKLYELEDLKTNISDIEQNISDYFERTFIKVFFKNCIQKNKKISKTNYLINLIFNILNK